VSTDLNAKVAQRAEQASNGVAKREQPQGLAAFIDGMKGEIARALPRHMNPERMARIALTCVRTTRNLDKCTTASFGGALMTCAQLGLEPGPTGEAYLLPFRNTYLSKQATKKAGHDVEVFEVQLVIGYQGMVKLFWQSPLAKSLDAQAVHENDFFDYEYGLRPRLEHKPSLNDRGRAIAYYAVATMTNGGSAFVVMSPFDIETIRKRSKAKDDGPWATDYVAMAKKTCLRQLYKLLPKSAELAQALLHDGGVRTDASAEAIDLTPSYIEGEVVGESDEAAPAAMAGEFEAMQAAMGGGSDG
jgi:recombination protein RecT